MPRTNRKKFSEPQYAVKEVNGAIMVVNDSLSETTGTLTILKQRGINGTILTRDGAWEALEFLQNEYVKGAILPRVIVLDMNMPELNGIDFLQAFQHLPALIRNWCNIIIVNGSEEMVIHDYVMKFPQVIYYSTGMISFESIDRALPFLNKGINS